MKKSSPLLSKILRRQKIYTEASFSLKSVDNSQNCDVVANMPTITITDVFFSYSDIYVKHHTIIYSSEMEMSSFIQIDTGILIQSNSSYVEKSFGFVPFYKNYLTIPPVGVLLDLPKSLINTKCSAKPSVGTYFALSTPVSCSSIYSYPKKIYGSYYCRNSFTECKRRKVTLDLDEIVPVVEEFVPQNDNRRVSRAGYASEGDILILDPLLLEAMPRMSRSTSHLTESEQNKIARITISYIWAFFLR